MKKSLLIALLALSLAPGLRAAEKIVYSLDAAASTLTASALKNESVTVKVNFPVLSGTLDLGSGKASVSTDLKGLQSGNPVRDTNIQTLFFEVAKKAAYGTASFSWKGKAKDLKALVAGTPQNVTLNGELSLHGSKTKLGGPAVLSLQADGSYKASFSGWTVDVQKSKLGKVMAAMNKVCPQPHRVGNEVGLAGELVFRKL
jgi:polyisoprenoid-binding protein YceI